MGGTEEQTGAVGGQQAADGTGTGTPQAGQPQVTQQPAQDERWEMQPLIDKPEGQATPEQQLAALQEEIARVKAEKSDWERYGNEMQQYLAAQQRGPQQQPAPQPQAAPKGPEIDPENPLPGLVSYIRKLEGRIAQSEARAVGKVEEFKSEMSRNSLDSSIRGAMAAVNKDGVEIAGYGEIAYEMQQSNMRLSAEQAARQIAARRLEQMHKANYVIRRKLEPKAPMHPGMGFPRLPQFEPPAPPKTFDEARDNLETLMRKIQEANEQ